MGGYGNLPQLRYPEQPDPMQQAGRVLQLKSLISQQQQQEQLRPLQLQQQQNQVQSSGLDLEQKQYEKKLRDAYIKSQTDATNEYNNQSSSKDATPQKTSTAPAAQINTGSLDANVNGVNPATIAPDATPSATQPASPSGNYSPLNPQQVGQGNSYFDILLKHMQKNGLPPDQLVKVQENIVAMRTKNAQMSEAQSKAENEKAQQLSGLLYASDKVPDAQLNKYLLDNADTILQNTPTILQPSIQKALQSIPNMQPQQVREAINTIFKPEILGMKSDLDIRQKQAQMATETAKMPGEKAKSLQQEADAVGQQLLAAANDPAKRQRILAQASPEVFSMFEGKSTPEQIQQVSMSPEKQASVPVDRLSLNAFLAKNPGKTAMDYEQAKAGFSANANAAAQSRLLTGDALDLAASNYAQTGQMPSGMRSPGMVSSIINRAAQMYKGTDLSTNKAVYAANKSSLENVTKTLDTLSSFESAANKNLAQFMSLANKIPDTGVPWLNTPIRLLNDKMIGAEYAPAVAAARSIASREIARVTNDPKLSGSLTDSARNEVENFNPTNATLPQVKHIVEVLQTDMANVHSSLNQQKSDIQARLKLNPTATSAPQQQNAPQNNAPVKQQWSASAWAQANPGKDVNKAKAAATAKGYEVVN